MREIDSCVLLVVPFIKIIHKKRRRIFPLLIKKEEGKFDAGNTFVTVASAYLCRFAKMPIPDIHMFNLELFIFKPLRNNFDVSISVVACPDYGQKPLKFIDMGREIWMCFG